MCVVRMLPSNNADQSRQTPVTEASPERADSLGSCWSSNRTFDLRPANRSWLTCTHLTLVSRYHQTMPKRMPPEVLEYLRSLGKKYGSQGGKTAAKNMTAEERLARARKASVAAAKKRTAERLARGRASKRGKRTAKRT